MKNLHDILTPLVTMLLVSILASCSNQTELPTPLSPEAQIVLKLTVSDTSAGSRAPSTPEGGYHRGEGYENFIDVESQDFRLYFFDENNKFIAPFEVAFLLRCESGYSSKTYMVYSLGMTEALNQPIKVVALANWPAYPDASTLEKGVTTIADIVGQEYEFDASKMELSAENPVPLYGVTDVKTLSYNDENVADLGTIHMLRAYAKVEVNLNPDCVFPIEWVKLNRYNERGYCAPQGVYLQSQYVYNNYDQDYTHEPSIPAGAEVTKDLEFIKVDDSRWLAYVPEYRNVGRPDNQKSVIQIKFKGAESDVDNLYFATYDLNTSPNRPVKHFDVLRNVWYKFTVNKQSPPLVQVVPYNEVDLGPLFGLMIDRNLVPIYEEDGSIRYWYDRDTGLYYGPDKTTVIDDPYLTVDPGTGWTIIRDLNDRVIGYYDPKNGDYYDKDRNKVPYLNIDASTGWEIIRDKDGNVIGYYDPINDKYYDTDKKTEKPSLRELK